MKKGEYDIWAMKMEHYLGHTDYPIWEVVQKGNGHVQVSTYTNGQIKVLPPKTAKEILAREREIKARTTLLMSIPEDHLAKFHKITDAKEMWEAIKSRFGGDDESKKMHKYILKQQFESFSASPLKMPIRSSLGLYLLPGPKTSSTNDVSTAYGVSTSSGHNSCTLSLLFQVNGPLNDHKILIQGESCSLMPRNQLALTRKTKVESSIVPQHRHFCKREEPKALVTLDGDGVDWTGHAEDKQENSLSF
ncbi:hypothetical protein Tco_0817116 [Tanacetum coccineum]